MRRGSLCGIAATLAALGCFGSVLGAGDSGPAERRVPTAVNGIAPEPPEILAGFPRTVFVEKFGYGT